MATLRSDLSFSHLQVHADDHYHLVRFASALVLGVAVDSVVIVSHRAKMQTLLTALLQKLENMISIAARDARVEMPLIQHAARAGIPHQPRQQPLLLPLPLRPKLASFLRAAPKVSVYYIIVYPYI